MMKIYKNQALQDLNGITLSKTWEIAWRSLSADAVVGGQALWFSTNKRLTKEKSKILVDFLLKINSCNL